ncbi:hypothetical protein ACETRX_05005 [Labrys portucalensis]|uniref:Uncharacterized protein n=1 Tax=Labrys neptuniae TaxID=376174 RepID=A0ABV6Z9T8_9HYPH
MTSQQLEPTEDDFVFVPDNRPVHDDHDPAVEALEEKYWAIVSKFEGYGYGAKIVEPHDERLHIAVRVPDEQTQRYRR